MARKIAILNQKNMRELKYGGQIVPGDFIAVSDGNHLSFGWYAGNGRGTLQYYPMQGPNRVYKEYRAWSTLNDVEKAKNKWLTKRYEKGFTMKCLWKSFINSVHSTRVMKITNIEDIFTDQEDRIMYEESKQALITLKFIKQ
jgi:hypothetical protein